MHNQVQQKYDFKSTEARWRKYWQQIELYKTGADPEKPDIYILDFFPYPSGTGLSVGHGRNYVPTCVSSRFHRMRGYNVLHPMGWDAFGLPAENYAVAHGIHPRESTALFCDTYKQQMQLMECSYDWSREINSTYPEYYRWTQWFFLLLYERGLAYRAVGSQWWCPQDQTILANEQVENGRCWRCGTEVVKKELEQWYFKITDYADRLLADLETIDWPQPIKQMQRNWIGRSIGAEITFQVAQPERDGIWEVPVFTTRPDTLYGTTFLVLAPEHPLVTQVTTPQQETAVSAYVADAQRLTEIARLATDKERTGVFTGAYVAHPLTSEPVPVWVADYILPGYGTGAIMGVPAHDERDHAFARRHNLPLVTVVASRDEPEDAEGCFTGHGVLVNSGPYTGMESAEGGQRIVAALAQRGLAEPQVTYRMRDWLISRQRYWGAPIPIIHCPACGEEPVPQEDLPLLLPEMDDFAPAGDGRSPLAHAEEWVTTTCPRCGGEARRETDTMDGFACSSWYFLRFANPHFEAGPFDPQAVRRWLPVDIYVGGAEHAVMHLLYARFWTKVLYDAGLIDFVEPFEQLRNQGVLLAATDGHKMSKSRGNVVTPDEIAATYGTDALRMYLLFLGPFDADVTWDERGIKGVTRFLERYWRLAVDVVEAGGTTAENEAFERARHRIVARITYDMERFRFNTAVAALMEYLNTLLDHTETGIPAAQWRRAIETFTLLLCPMAPFITETVWQAVLAHTTSVHRQAWPDYDAAMLTAQQVTLVVQVNGRLRDRIEVDANATEAELRAIALASARIQRHINGKPIRRFIVIPGRLVNIVV